MTLKEGLEPKCSFSPAAKVGEGGCTLHCAPTEGPAQPLVWGVLLMVSHPRVPPLHPTSFLTRCLSPPPPPPLSPPAPHVLPPAPPGVPEPLGPWHRCHQAEHRDLPVAWGGQ